MIVKVLYPQKGSCPRTQHDNMDHSLLWLNIRTACMNPIRENEPHQTISNHLQPKQPKLNFCFNGNQQ